MIDLFTFQKLEIDLMLLVVQYLRHIKHRTDNANGGRKRFLLSAS
jgi:hypothetical protein